MEIEEKKTWTTQRGKKYTIHLVKHMIRIIEKAEFVMWLTTDS